MRAALLTLAVIAVWSAFVGLLLWATHRWVNWVHDRERGDDEAR